MGEDGGTGGDAAEGAPGREATGSGFFGGEAAVFRFLSIGPPYEVTTLRLRFPSMPGQLFRWARGHASDSLGSH
jgi:hypothetical protein